MEQPAFIRYCAHCGVPHSNRRSVFCKEECRKADKRLVRRENANRKCRLCGRAFRRKRTHPVASQTSGTK
jgi:hypothetical protein